MKKLGKMGSHSIKSHDSVQNYWLTVVRMPGFRSVGLLTN